MNNNDRLPQTWMLMTAMPPTKGHINMIKFAGALTPSRMHVVLATQPDEPMIEERKSAILRECSNIHPRAVLHHVNKFLPQEPDEETEAAFYGMWGRFLNIFGFKPGDYIVASENYGIKVAEYTGGIFMPYDIKRTILHTKATEIRNDTLENFTQIAPEFQHYLRKRITIFGAESTGKTTLAAALAKQTKSIWLPEWARPYMETVSPLVSDKGMHDIWYGQKALQEHADYIADDSPFIIQDTDLISTVGYWDQADSGMWTGGSSGTPKELVDDAQKMASDLYIVCPSNIPFEADPIRFGGDKRETPDEFWIEYLDKWNLNYVVLKRDYLAGRVSESLRAAWDVFGKPLEYTRTGAEYE